MRLVIAAVGKLKDGPERDLLDRYAKRIVQVGRALALAPFDIIEAPEGRGANADVRREDEASRLLKIVSGIDLVLALDESGRSMTSASFAAFLAKQRDGGAAGMAFLIGGPDGQGHAASDQAAFKLSLGPMTMPHGLARIVLAEQIYRATTILAGHPYHRA